MSEDRVDEERPCLHCMMVELIDDFFAEYPATAEQDGLIRQQVIDQNYALRRRVSS
jgi:hypothetical protein